MTDHLAITTDDLTKEYGDTTAVSGFTLAIEAGHVYGFLGPNGAGKTTTIRMLTALTEPTSGAGHVAGHPITNRQAIIPHIGYLPELPPIYDELTAREQLEYHGGLRDMDPVEIEDRIEELLDRFDLTGDADDRISTYSKGMKQKTGLVQALMHEPDVVILDEPTSGLDPRAARTVRDTITELAAGDRTVFLSTHILPVVAELATEVGILYDGELVAEGAPEELKDRMEAGGESTLEDVFLEVTTDEAYEADESPSDTGVSRSA
ncbi:MULTISPECIES: ABC transporter ATP-binding protein [Halobacterium]|uniref:ABC-type transport system ATP-binding protein n=3 Tax=Halobacterium salinarum TaxID=2242 RepID=Q9HHM2_HALSA|nr:MULTISPECIES: ABC transporter ATP-binding protein [Halobacterium]AAG20956.1 daunorubicin resistance ABC transporter ATP-binding protein [Halobacterium salinarum NRC-1]MBB6090532.1 ABC-2 type transport system ATP-binding protein [Halobacterium salinarum]MCF2208351.1 ABC transporter ATP-binding protein [Halobacterium salinarum]MCF2240121.1 ABC transporter ATP-binding protein [Halobacterium salinarum]MDL0131594.1 ABC transporter ATP-binding protein [Halobacterium salinarum]